MMSDEPNIKAAPNIMIKVAIMIPFSPVRSLKLIKKIFLSLVSNPTIKKAKTPIIIAALTTIARYLVSGLQMTYKTPFVYCSCV